MRLRDIQNRMSENIKELRETEAIFLTNNDSISLPTNEQ